MFRPIQLVTEEERLVYCQEQPGKTQRLEQRVRMENLKTAVAKIREKNKICLQIMNSPFFRFSFIWKLLAHLSLWPRESKEFSSISNQDEGQQEANRHWLCKEVFRAGNR